jgi:hypothetical protein
MYKTIKQSALRPTTSEQRRTIYTLSSAFIGTQYLLVMYFSLTALVLLATTAVAMATIPSEAPALFVQQPYNGIGVFGPKDRPQKTIVGWAQC